MSIDAFTFTLLGSVLRPATTRELFRKIANSRIAEATQLKADDPAADQDLGILQSADLIASGSNGSKYYVTAKGLKVARDLEQIPSV